MLLHVQVFEFVKLKELYYAGSHGMDILVSSADSQSETKDVSHFFVTFKDDVLNS